MVESLRKTTSVFALILLLVGCNTPAKQENAPSKEADTLTVLEPENRLPVYLEVLKECYGKHFSVIDSNTILWNDGDTLMLDDYKKKTAKEALDNADIEDMFRVVYPASKQTIPADSAFDPGRYRNELFFRKMYGGTKEETEQYLEEIPWMPRYTETKLKITTVNGCKDSLQKVSEALSLLPDSLLKYVTTTAGTFYYRTIAGTNRLSCHSYGIAIDINTKYSHYWRWAKDKDNVEYRNSVPYEIVRIFEKYGFIWGGNWYHYDTMHFEFRPELIKYKGE